MRIEQSAGLDDSEIQRMQKDAESHAEEDKRKRELAEARNHAEHTCYQLEKTMKEHADKLSDTDREPLTKAIEKVREAAKGEDAASIKSALNDLEQASHAYSRMLYEHAQPQATGATAEPSGNGSESASSRANDDAIDAEFEVKS